ncbi:sensor histidine kinase [Streptomyces sp. NPDC086080]|uniref:sensor histidine kinase n=1 Tax=Streptomyces sp. NPDC086080 TaxID=3365748 RepID=UPI0037D922B8
MGFRRVWAAVAVVCCALVLLTLSPAASPDPRGVAHPPPSTALSPELPHLVTGSGAAAHLTLLAEEPGYRLAVFAAASAVSYAGPRLGGVGRELGPVGVLDVLVLITAVLGATWVGRSRRRLCEVERAARQLGEGDLSIRVPASEGGPVSVRRLAGAFNDMADALGATMKKQTAFAADAAHQLRNPLTVLSLRMEVLSLSLEGEGREQVELIREEMNRLDIMLGQLLELASAPGAPGVRREPLDAVDLVAGRIEAWRPQAEHRCVRLELAADHPSPVLTDAALAGSILDTLLDNAIKYSPFGGRITVRLGDRGDMTSIEIRDEGPGLAAVDLQCAGDRFWRGSTAREAPGTGLGLSIARELATAIGGRVTITGVAPHGLCVALHIPAAPAYSHGVSRALD